MVRGDRMFFARHFRSLDSKKDRDCWLKENMSLSCANLGTRGSPCILIANLHAPVVQNGGKERAKTQALAPHHAARRAISSFFAVRIPYLRRRRECAGLHRVCVSIEGRIKGMRPCWVQRNIFFGKAPGSQSYHMVSGSDVPPPDNTKSAL